MRNGFTRNRPGLDHRRATGDTPAMAVDHIDKTLWWLPPMERAVR